MAPSSLTLTIYLKGVVVITPWLAIMLLRMTIPRRRPHWSWKFVRISAPLTTWRLERIGA